MSEVSPDDRIFGEFELVLDNLNLATLLAQKILDDNSLGMNFSATVFLRRVDGVTVNIPGSNHGFFSSPIIHNAILDVARTLEFFRLGFKKGTCELSNLEKVRNPDDLTILDFGLPMLTYDRLLELSLRLTGRSPAGFLHQVQQYRHKELAHFTKTSASPDLIAIVESTKLCREALLVFLYDAIPKTRPSIQPTFEEGQSR